jgi:hypothetical protein
LAGCAGLFETRPAYAPPAVVENRPNAVYMPSHVEGMKMASTGTGGDYAVGVMYSYPHRFWTVDQEGDGLSTSRVEVGPDDDVHLMTVVWDPESNTVLPDTGVSVEIARDGELVSQETIYQMLSMRMGYHHGGNFPLDGDGTYTVTVSIGGTGVRRTGGFEGRFGEPASIPVEFEYSQSTRDEIPFQVLDNAGEPGATDPMNMEMMPSATVPPTDELPGSVLGEATSGDARFVASRVDAADGPYLAVWAATPYNRLLIPNMALSASTDGFEGALSPTLHPELGYHYGAALPADTPGDAPMTVDVDLPPFVARHEGYETAFLEMPSMEFGG